MSVSSIRARPIKDLLGSKFFIPDYQRGYRWSKQQVKELLDDILTFQNSDEARTQEGFYCLQPIVTRPREESALEVIDGQQRLTTLYLILQYLNELRVERRRFALYSIEYQTRAGSQAFLLAPKAEMANENIDFHFIFCAKTTIEEWFADKDHLIGDFESTLLQRVKVIWYELPTTEPAGAIDAFTRLNIGKIRLTNAELIRGIFLRSKEPQPAATVEQLKLAQEWDGYERALREDDFWYFLVNRDRSNRTNRIELIFELVANAANAVPSAVADAAEVRDTFHLFSDRLLKERPLDVWNEVKQYFMTLEEWYRDPKSFHLIGFLLNEGIPLSDLVATSRRVQKSVFIRDLKQRILQRFLREFDLATTRKEVLHSALEQYTSELDYHSDIKAIRSLLLLFNIASIVANEKTIARFRFDYFKKDHWDIEHVRSVKSQRPSANVDKRSWLVTVRDYFAATGENAELHQQAATLVADTSYTIGNAFDAFYDRILAEFGERESYEAENGLGNLALLDSSTNRSYKNAVFPIKRKLLLDFDKHGTFIPLGTRNVFLKCYSRNVEHMFSWTPQDQGDYRAEIVRTLAEFFLPSISQL